MTLKDWDNGALLQRIRDYADLILEESENDAVQNYIGQILAYINELEGRQSFSNIINRRR